MRRSPLKKTSSQLKAIAKRKAWTEFSIFIRRRDPFCITCGAKTTEAGHFIHQISMLELYFDPTVVNGQCGRCNRWLHGNLGVYAVELDKKYGAGTAEKLLDKVEKRNKLPRATQKFYEELYEKYKKKNEES